jgi:cytochrome P450
LTEHKTTSTATTWALFALTQNIAAQTRLRAELLSVPTETPSMEELNALPYLDCVVREVLRVYPPVISTGTSRFLFSLAYAGILIGNAARVATLDDVVPLATPWTDADGTAHKTLR